MTDIFIRTYHKDLPWLAYCLKSIHNFVSGYRKIIICIPKSQVHYIKKFNLSQEIIVTCQDYVDDYIGQQIEKIKAFQYSDADHILFVDSDCVFHSPCDVSKFFFEKGKPILYGRPFVNLGDAMCWKEPTHLSLGFEPEYETMCRLPIVHNREVLNDSFNALTINGTLQRILKPNSRFSEFNTLGNFALTYHKYKYRFIDVTKVDAGPAAVKQFWSWAGLTNETKKELEELLK